MSREILPSGGREVRVALGFPSYRNVAEGNLGFQIVTGILRSVRGIQCEQFYLPEGSSHSDLRLPEGGLRTVPSGRSLASMDLVLLSLSYEGDAVAVPALLEAGGLPAFAGERRAGHPLVVGGGALVMINPEPLAPFFDLFLVGEAEAILEPFLARWGAHLGEGR
ncbi:MAG: hypothetical protein KAY24_05865, partial [Candidatus Eisenbacteria sp.]|nr:hypothetical protein [Candidatus Eisenbacteria bacterium]